ncbi:MAG: hypothetical protein L3J11_07750, partial [Draconibacterium sp.]|nr:hypothetical protein [Draconibacterium sp.]
MLKTTGLFVLLLIATITFAQQSKIDLSGEWQFAMDSLNVGEQEQWYNKDLPDHIHLPSTMDEAGYGKPHIPETLLCNGKPEIWQLARKHCYTGVAWYRKSVDIPKEWRGKQIKLFFERSMWQVKLWINGRYVGEQHSLSKPGTFDITSFLKPGKNIIAMSVDNSPYVHLGSWSHGYSDGIQTIWNGIVGKIEMIAKDNIHLSNVRVYPSFKDQKLKVRCNVISVANKNQKGQLKFTVSDDLGNIILTKKEKVKLCGDTSTFEVVIDLENKLKKWDEFSPELYHLNVSSSFAKDKDSESVRFGLRDVEAVDGRFVVNGNRIFMRGEHDAGSFPLTGYPSMEKEDWLRIFKIGKDFGFNHWRFHSWCPPEAAFEAADETGIYLQPELPLFSQDWEHTLVGTDKARDEFLFSELKRVLDSYGNHPSFVFMCMGNELRGDHKVLERWVRYGRSYDP